MKNWIGAFRTSKYLPRAGHVATQHSMRGSIASFLILIGLFVGVVIAPAMAHAGGGNPVHATEMLDVHEIDEADHKHSQESDKDMPCHAVGHHHHCSIALHLDAPRMKLNALAKGGLVRPAVTTPLFSRSQAPPLEPPLA